MKNHEMVTSIREAERLEELEKTIARGKQTFVEVGVALAEIRDLRLYRREYGSFAEYCQQKWGWERAHAYRLIDAAEVAKVSPMGDKITNERAARELAKVGPGERDGVVQAIVDQGKPVTAAEIKRHLPPPPMVRRGTKGTEGTEGTNGANGNNGTNGTNGTGGSAASSREHRTGKSGEPADRNVGPMPPPPPSQVLDGTGWPIPTQIIPLWQRADEVQEMLTTLSRVKGGLRAAQENRDKLFAEVNFSSALSQLDQAWTDIKTAKPFAVCPTCQGQLPDKCTLCRGRGLISEHRWNTCVTREDKEFREKAKKGKAETATRQTRART